MALSRILKGVYSLQQVSCRLIQRWVYQCFALGLLDYSTGKAPRSFIFQNELPKIENL